MVFNGFRKIGEVSSTKIEEPKLQPYINESKGQVIEERWMFTIKRYPNGKCFATAPFIVGQNYGQPKKQKKLLNIDVVDNVEQKSIFEVD
jgi:hypothetical protein